MRMWDDDDDDNDEDEDGIPINCLVWFQLHVAQLQKFEARREQRFLFSFLITLFTLNER